MLIIIRETFPTSFPFTPENFNGRFGLTPSFLWDRITDVAQHPSPRVPNWIILGDGLFLLGVTLAGEVTHGISLLSPRWLTTFIPLLIGWALSAPPLGLYHTLYANRFGVSVRTLWAVLLAVPLAIWLRGFWLQTAVVPLFVLVLTATTGVALATWREIAALVLRSRKA